jgi:hypothetical protein
MRVRAFGVAAIIPNAEARERADYSSIAPPIFRKFQEAESYKAEGNR